MGETCSKGRRRSRMEFPIKAKLLEGSIFNKLTFWQPCLLSAGDFAVPRAMQEQFQKCPFSLRILGRGEEIWRRRRTSWPLSRAKIIYGRRSWPRNLEPVFFRNCDLQLVSFIDSDLLMPTEQLSCSWKSHSFANFVDMNSGLRLIRSKVNPQSYYRSK